MRSETVGEGNRVSTAYDPEVDRPEGLLGCLRRLVEGIGIGDVERQDRRAATETLDVLTSTLQPVVASRDERYVGSPSRIVLRKSPTDAR